MLAKGAVSLDNHCGDASIEARRGEGDGDEARRGNRRSRSRLPLTLPRGEWGDSRAAKGAVPGDGVAAADSNADDDGVLVMVEEVVGVAGVVGAMTRGGVDCAGSGDGTPEGALKAGTGMDLTSVLASLARAAMAHLSVPAKSCEIDSAAAPGVVVASC